MPFQINASYTEQIVFEGTPLRGLYGILLEAIPLIGWSRGVVTEDTITAFAGLSLTSFGEVIHLEINHSLVTVTSSCLMPQIWSVGKNKRNIRKLERAINHLLANRTEEQLHQKYMAASAEFIATGHDKTSNEQFRQVSSSTSKISSFLSIFNPKPGYFITPLLIDLNVLYFILIGLAGGGFWNYSLRGFNYLGVNLLDLTLTQGQWWRLLTYQFMHAGFLHLIGNMFSLLMVGAYLEPLLGKARFLIFYLLCGMMGGLLSIYMHPFNGSVGASGAILGMYGVFLALLTSNLIEKHTRKAIFSTLLFFITLQLLFGLQGQTDNSAHIGGLVTGFLLGIISISALRTANTWKTIQRLSIITILAGIAVFFSLKKMPNPANTFRALLEQFGQNDAKALHYLSILDNASDEEIIREIEYQSMGFMKQNTVVLHQLDQLPIGANGHYRVNLMRKGVLLEAKKAGYQLLWILHNRNDHKYVDAMHACDTELNQILYELGNTGWTFQ